MTLHRLAVPVFSLSLLLLGGCGGAPGEKLSASPQQVWAENNCSSRRLPVVQLDAAQVHPATVRRGRIVNSRFIYSLCLADGRQHLSGRMRTRVYRGTQIMISDTTPDYKLKPGRWTVDSSITVPADAPEGAYYVRVDFSGPVSFNGGSILVVRR